MDFMGSRDQRVLRLVLMIQSAMRLLVGCSHRDAQSCRDAQSSRGQPPIEIPGLLRASAGKISQGPGGRVFQAPGLGDVVGLQAYRTPTLEYSNNCPWYQPFNPLLSR